MTAQRQLIVMRHAKAGELPGGPDVERALRPRGCRNASAAGQWLAARGLVPDLVLCSNARRARQTWQYVSAELAGEPRVFNDPRLYHADATDLLEIFAEAPAQARSLMYVGHNPAAADLAEILTGGPVDFPTAAIAIIGLDGGWPDLSQGSEGAGELVAAWTPQPES
ncbi:MAG TPA: histidine phosphatase family protein [Streptosporangiaceae bacterium]|nr:histidine phosphatase family protein [Streptosporangiaceae bacterium]HUZ50950.1 histidine phosphatase family protein [Streptosporangiaceae bacterium]